MSFQPVLQVLPLSLREVIRALPSPVLECLEEVRVRQERPLEIVTNEESWFVSRSSRLSKQPHDAMIPNKEDCLNLLNLISNHSLYAMDEELRRGYVTSRRRASDRAGRKSDCGRRESQISEGHHRF